MKLKPVLDTLDGLDDNLHQFYVEFTVGGITKWKLDVENVTSHPDAGALTRAHDRQKLDNAALRTENEDLKLRLDGLPEDFDSDAYDVLKARAEANGQLPNEEEIRTAASEAATTRAEKKFAKERDTLTAERDKHKAANERNTRNLALDTALDEVNVVDPVYRKAARALLAPNVKVAEDEGDFVALYNDPDLGDIPVAEHVKQWAESDEGKYFVGARESGGGGAHGSGGGTPPTPSNGDNPWKRGKTWNATRQAQIKTDSPQKAQALMREAGIRIPQ